MHQSCSAGLGVGGVVMVTSELLLKLELGPGLTEYPVRLVVVSAEIRAILWGAGLVGADSKPAFNCGGAGLLGETIPRGWICGCNWGILLDSSSLSTFFDHGLNCRLQLLHSPFR